jgi:hypothetical protein
MFVGYLALSVAYSPEFLVSDIRHKWSALADDTITITGRVLGPPQKPVVTASPVCSSGTLSISLDWADDENSQSFDVLRDGSLLVTGLAASSYDDTAVAAGETHTYEVIGTGAMGPGTATSDPVSATLPVECVVVFVPEVNIVTFQGKSVSEYVGIPKTHVKKPVLTGTTNIAFAQVDFLINDSMVISARVSANENGYWDFKIPVNLSHGIHTVFVTATDPENPAVSVFRSLTFRIVKRAGSTDDESESAVVSRGPSAPSIPGAPSVSLPAGPDISPDTDLIPLDFTLRTLSDASYQGRDIPFAIDIVRLDPSFSGIETVARYSVVDYDGNVVATSTGNVTLLPGRPTFDRVFLPPYVAEGKYRLRAELLFGKYTVAREVPVSVLSLPILSFGGGLVLTYPGLLSRIGTASILLLLLLLLWASLFFREYLLYSESFRHITERNLIGAGFFGRKKGKGVSG